MEYIYRYFFDFSFEMRNKIEKKTFIKNASKF